MKESNATKIDIKPKKVIKEFSKFGGITKSIVYKLGLQDA